jgi:hypothetical protein
MKLSQIVAFKNYLEQITPLDAPGLIYEKLGDVLHCVQTRDVQFSNLTNVLGNNYQSIVKSINKFEYSLDLIKLELDNEIARLEPNYYAESYRLYSQEMIHDIPEYILDRRLDINVAASEFITSRLLAQGDWRHAGIILRPAREDWIIHLVGCDPLYLVDQNSELLEPAVLRFNDQYQRRLRTYTVNETADTPVLSQLPDRQFAFCLAYNFFNYKPLEIIQIYLKELYNKLKPGGVLAMTFNDCDREGGVKLAERSFMSYTPGRAIFKYAKDLGFEIQESRLIDSATTWVELRRSGTLTSLRGGQSLAKIVYKDAESMYTTEEIQKFKQQALDLNIVHPTRINEVPLAQLIDEIKQRIKL